MSGALPDMQKAPPVRAEAFLLEPPNGIEPLTFSLPWRRSAD